MARRLFVAGNWKMHGSGQLCNDIIEPLKQRISGCTDIDMAICPPYPYLMKAADMTGDSAISVGAQDICDQVEQGAFTGEVNGAMLVESGCRFVIIGHSERRALYGDTNELVAAKFAAAQEAGLVPILCVGETLEQREQDLTDQVLAEQLDAVLGECGVQAFDNAVLAYEPVWAIGTGKTASAAQAQEAHVFLRARIADQDDIIAGNLRILYGGSVKPDNAGELFGCDDVDGGLIGGASLKADSFADICQAAQKLA